MSHAALGHGEALALARPRGRAADFVELTKPRVVLMVLVTTLAGYYLGLEPGSPASGALVHTLLGVALAAAGTLALNMYLERDLDALMERTRRRPLPEGRLEPREALLFGAALTAGGIAWLALTVNPICAAVTAATAIGYLAAYTPLKRRSALCSLVGAVPGALPPVAGWAAARGTLDPGAWVLFSILFLWQMPHSLAIARLYRDDYARAGVAVLPVVDPNGRSTDRLILSHALALVAVALLPTLIGMCGPITFVAALALGLGQFAFALRLALEGSDAAARRLLHATLIYLPALLAVMTFERAWL
jgi:protoheme IX farnesyltransferase